MGQIQFWASRPGVSGKRHKEVRPIQDSGASAYLGHGPRRDSVSVSETAQPRTGVLQEHSFARTAQSPATVSMDSSTDSRSRTQLGSQWAETGEHSLTA